MEENKQEKEERKLYYAVVTFWAPVGGNTTILARDEEHAKEILAEMYRATRELEIVDLYDLDESPKLKKMLDTPSNSQLH